MQFDRHTLVLLVRPPDASELTDEEAAELQDRPGRRSPAPHLDGGGLTTGCPVLGNLPDSRIEYLH